MLHQDKWSLIRFMLVAFVLTQLHLVSLPRTLQAETPDSPRVKAMVERATGFLEQRSTTSEHVGGKCLIALALYKAGKAKHEQGKHHPKVQEALDAIDDLLAQNKNDPSSEWDKLYSPCIAAIFLMDYDSEEFEQKIKQLLDAIFARQVKQGAFGYLDGTPGDVSQTQYACLVLWYARKKGFECPKSRGAAVLNWLVKVQAQDGRFFYKESIPPTGTGRRNESLAAAGMSSVYITADWLGLNPKKTQGQEKDKKKKGQADFDLPSTVTLVGSEDGFDGNNDDDVKVQVPGLEQCKARGNTHFANNFKAQVNDWQFYYLYGFERYAAFWELAEGIDDPEPKWYNDGVDLLAKLQGKDGGWISRTQYTEPGVATSFAVLFLIRGTKKVLDVVYESGQLTGGGELSDGKLAMRGGKIVPTMVTKNVGDLMAMAETATDQDWESFAQTVDKLTLSEDSNSRTQQLAKLRSLTSHRHYRARQIAVTQLGKLRDFESVPILIYALGDPDSRVASEAHSSLRVVSRKFDVAKVEPDADLEKFKNLKRIWKKWYLQIQPDAVFLD